jgi:serine/threonine-protein kinase
VAIKEPVTPAGGDPATVAEMSERFVREGKAAAQLNHPGIVTIYGADIYDGRPAIVMELIGGRTLSQVIDDGRLSPSAAVAIIDQLLDAVSFAHSRGVVHRDIKPDNIFVTDDGRVKLADFGIAHVGTTSTMTQAGQVLGTPGYMAPEQVVGSPVDARADIFAIGVIAYELLAGTNPFGATEAAPPTTVLYRIVHETPPTPAQLDPTVPQWLAAVISRAMAKDPAARYQSAEEMRADLRAQSAPSPGAWSAGPVATGAVGGAKTTYWVVGGAVVVAALALAFVFAGGNGGAVTGASGSVTTETSAASAPTSAPSVAPAGTDARSIYRQEGQIDRDIAGCATQVNRELAHGIVSNSSAAQASDLVGTTQSLLSEAENLSSGTGKDILVAVLRLDLTRAESLSNGCVASQEGSSPKPAFLAGHYASQKLKAGLRAQLNRALGD